MTRQRLSQLFALAAIILMIVAAFVLQAPNAGTLRKAYILNLSSMGRITETFSQWSNAYAFHLIAGDGTPAKLGLGIMLAGGVMLGLALYFNRPLSLNLGKSAPPLESVSPPLIAGQRVGRIRLLIGLVCLTLLTERNGNLFKIDLIQKLNVHAQAVLLFFGLLFTTSALIGNQAFWKTRRIRLSSQTETTSSPPATKQAHLEWIVLAAITLLALLVRSWKLGSAIHGLIDEMHFINAVTLLWKYPNEIRMLQPFSNIPAFPWVFPYMQWGSTEIFGNNLVGLRIISVLMGTATIPLLYLLARSLFDKPTALIAALMLATFPPHIHYSRAGINNIADPLVGTAALAFLAYGLRTRQRWAFVLAGISLGLTQYFYDGGRLLYPALTLVWLIFAGLIYSLNRPTLPPVNIASSLPLLEDVSSSPSPIGEEVGGEVALTPLSTEWGGVGGGDISRPRLRSKLLFFLLAFLLIATPIYYTRFGLDSGFSSRSHDVSAGNDFWRTVLIEDHGDLLYLRHLAYTFLIYIYMPEMSWFYGGHTPLILHAFVPLFLLGLFWAIWNWRQSGALLLILWLVLVSFGNSLLSESGTSARYVVIFPALALVMAIGLRQSVSLLLADLWPKRAQFGVMALVVIVVAGVQTGYYFDRHIDAYNYGRLSLDADDAMFRAVDLPTNTQVHIVNPVEILSFNTDTLKVFLGRPDLQVEGLYPEGLTDAYLDALPRNVNHAFFLPPDRYDLLVLLVHYFELDTPQYSPYNVPRQFQFVLYFAPASRNRDYPGEEAWMRRNPLE